MLNFLKHLLYFSLLTLFSQVGGLIYFIYLLLKRLILRDLPKNWKYRVINILLFIGTYAACSMFLVPPLAKLGGRVPLPISSDGILKPGRSLFYILNRHYVSQSLHGMLQQIQHDLAKSDKQLKLIYLDANFPFWNGFPLLPHLSHSDGKKLDINFLYLDQHNNRLNKSPSSLGYGHLELPKSGESNTAHNCVKQGFWFYNFTAWLNPFPNKKYQFDVPANRELLLLIAKHPRIDKIFIEPHLKSRLGLGNYSQVKFHGCYAVRHDDHIHLQIN